MKVNIWKYAEGGGGLAFVQPNFIIDTPTPTAPITKSAGSSGSQTTDKEGILDDDIYKELLKSGGLTSDVNSLIAELGKADYSPMGLSDSYNTSKILKLIGKVNEIKNNKAMWDKAIEVSRDTGGYAETAISNTGELFYRTSEGGIGTTNITQLKKNPEKYSSLLSVADLLLMREKNPGLAFNTSIFNIAQSSVGIDKVMENVKDLFSTLTDYTEISERHYSKEDVKRQYQLEKEALQRTGRKPTQEEVRGIKSLAELQNTPGEFLKVELEESRKGKDLKAALRYIMAGLGAAELKKLEFAAVTNGYSKGEEMIADMLINQSGGKSSSKISPEKESAIRETADKESQKPLTNFQMFNNDKLAVPGMTFAFNDPKVSTMFRGVVTGVSPLIKPNGQAIGYATIGEILSGESYGTFLEGNDVYFGNKKVDPTIAHTLVYDSQDAAKVYMPVGRDGRPDYEDLAEFKKVYAVYDANKDSWSTAMATKHFRDAGYNIEIQETEENGKRVKVIKENSHVKPFLVFFGYTNDATGLTEDNPWVKKLSKDEEQSVLPILEAKWTIGTGKNTKVLTPDKDWHKEKYYKGIITIPYRTGSAAIVNSLVGQGPTATLPKYADVQRNLFYSNNQPATWNPSAAQLNQ